MATQVSVSVLRSFNVGASPEKAHELVANVPLSASHFPGLDQVEDLGDGGYRWDMTERKAAGQALKVVYAATYISNPQTFDVDWTAIEGVGNSALSGHWRITADGEGAQMEFLTKGELAVPVPKLMAKMARGIVQSEFEKDVDGYIANLQKSLAG